MKKYIRNVNTKNAVNTIIFSLLVLLLAFIPFVIKSSSNFLLYYETLPFVGDGSLGLSISNVLEQDLTPLYDLNIEILTIILDTIITITYYLPIAFFSIIALDLALTILLLLIRRNWLRVVFKILSIVMGIAMIFITILFAYYLIFVVLFYIDSNILFTETGIFAIFFSTIISAILTIKQFTWFKKLY